MCVSVVEIEGGSFLALWLADKLHVVLFRKPFNKWRHAMQELSASLFYESSTNLEIELKIQFIVNSMSFKFLLPMSHRTCNQKSVFLLLMMNVFLWRRAYVYFRILPCTLNVRREHTFHFVAMSETLQWRHMLDKHNTNSTEYWAHCDFGCYCGSDFQ